MNSIANLHSHNPLAPIRSVEPGQLAAPQSLASPHDGQLLTVGIHPWHTDSATDQTLAMLRQDAMDQRVVAIGEIGLDPLQGAPLERQMELLEAQIDIAEELCLPVVLHIVRRYDLLLQLLNRRRPSVNIAIHGFRGKPQIAASLCSKGLYLSLGEHFNADAAAIIPADRLLIETDDAPLEALPGVAQAVASARHISASDILATASANLHRFLHR